MDAVKPSTPLKMTGNVDANWRTFKQKLQLYMVGVDRRAEERKKALLLTIAGAEAIEVLIPLYLKNQTTKTSLMRS